MRVRTAFLTIGIVALLATGYKNMAYTHSRGGKEFQAPGVGESQLQQPQIQEPVVPEQNEDPIRQRPQLFRVPQQLTRPFSLLVLGLDSRQGEPARSDTIMLAVLDQEHKTVKLLQIPRDTYVPVPGHGHTKINHAMTYGGPELMKKTVEEWLNTSIDHTAVVDFAGFRKLVDLLGGVPVNVEKNMDYDDPTDGTHIHLRKGEQVLNGKQALDYTRFRYDPEADTGRMRRQQQVLRAMVKKGMSLDTVPKIFQIVGILGDHLKTTMPPGEIMFLAKSYYRFDTDGLQTEPVKGINRVARNDGLWYFFVEKEEQERLQQLLANWLRGNP